MIQSLDHLVLVDVTVSIIVLAIQLAALWYLAHHGQPGKVPESELRMLRKKQDRVNRLLIQHANETRDMQWYRVLTSNLPRLAMLVFDTNMTFILAVGQELERAGYKPDEMVGRTLDDIVPAETAMRLRTMYAAALRGEHIQQPYISATSHKYTVYVLPLYDEYDKVIGGMVIAAVDDGKEVGAWASPIGRR